MIGDARDFERNVLAALSRVVDLHVSDGHPTHPCCVAEPDGVAWPCETIREIRRWLPRAGTQAVGRPAQDRTPR